MNYNALKNINVLYAEDDEDTLKLTSMVLEDYVGNLVVAQNGKDALDIFERGGIDLVVTDILMPKLSGIDLIKSIKSIDPNASTILTTAHAEVNYLLDAIKIGVDGYVLKPLDIEELLCVMSKSVLPCVQASTIQSQSLLINAISTFVGGRKIEIIKFLIDNADENNVYNGSYEDILEAINVSKPTVVKTFKQLIDSGLITRVKNKVYKIHKDILQK